MTSVLFEPPLPQLDAALPTTIAAPDLHRFGARIETPGVRAIVSRWEPATLNGDSWTVTLDAPPAGEFVLAWRTNEGDPPAFEYLESFTWPPGR